MIELDNKDWDYFHSIKEKVLDELIKDLDGIELPPEWRPKDVLWFVINKLNDYRKNI